MSELDTPPSDSPIARQIPYLRRHARMLMGSQASADRLVAETFETIARPADAASPERLKTFLFGALHRALAGRPADAAAAPAAGGRQASADARLQALSPRHRAVLLLTAVEELPLDAVAEILGTSTEEIERLADEAQVLVERGLATSVLIIEDEWLIARDLRRIVSELGHEVAAMAATHAEAVEAAKRFKPGLILADIQLADGSCGGEAALDVAADGDAPTVFVTAFPERLLTGRRPEPTYLITKPYSSAMIQATVSQALFFAGRA